jgi:UDP-3-O-[3-hydroxymyristoyl] glucosamine N-acyltransferase
VAWSLAQIVAALGGELRGDGSIVVSQVAPLARAEAHQIGFVAHPKYRSSIAGTQAGAVIVPPALADEISLPRIVIRDPYLYFAKVAQLLNPTEVFAGGVHPTAVVLSDLPASVYVGPHAYVAEGCSIGENVVIGPGCVVERACTIGSGSVMRARVTVCFGSSIGERCLIHPGAVIGSDGFGFARRPDGSWEKIPQIGCVRIGDDVELGANVAIDRGALDDTVIERGAKLDNLVHISHNSRIGEDAALAAQFGMAGSTTLGKRFMAGGQSAVDGHITVCDDVVISGQSCLTKNITEKGVYTSVIPSQPHQQWMRNAVHIKHLDDLVSRVRELEKKLKLMGEEE